jgi:hypothetical protein
MSRVLHAWLVLLGASLSATSGLAADEVDFQSQIAPLLIRSCVACHNASDPAGGLNLTRRDKALAGGESGRAAIVPGDTAASHLLERLTAGEMPPEGKGARLSAEQIALVGRWISAGATWPADRQLSASELTTDVRAGRDWWSLQPPRRPSIPKVERPERVRTPIDAFVLAELDRRGLSLSDDADRATLIRRATLDLHGLPPAPEAIATFVADTAPDAYERLIDRLLASPRYGERWARHWLDVARFGESNGYETNTARPNAWPYRDWVIRALNEDMPYPRFVLEQLAGDQLESDAATGFLVGGAHDVVASPDVELTLQQRLNDLDDMISTTSTAFLGLTIGCAKCHDHKFDPVSQNDYYAMQAFFSGVRHGERELRTPDSPRRQRQEAEARDQLAAVERAAAQLTARHQPLARLEPEQGSLQRPAVTAGMNVDRFAPVRARFVRFTARATNQYEPCVDELEVFSADEPARNLALASAGAKATASSVYAKGTTNLHKLEHVNDGRYGNGRSWISAEQGGGWVQIELPQPAVIERVVWARDREGAFRDRLATSYRIDVSEDGAQWQGVATSDDRRAFNDAEPPTDAAVGLPEDVVARLARYRDETATLRVRLEQLAPQKAYAGTFSEPDVIHLLYRGEPMQKRDPVSPAAIAAVGVSLRLDAKSSDAERRVALARWIGSPFNPLSARVIVNRLWHYHFGQGLVQTPSDFGFHGGRPSHPELLDWLASELPARGWSLKQVHRTIMLSTVYRQSSRHDARSAAVDAGDRLLWRFAPRRLEAEAIRDSILAAAGTLDLQMGGPGYEAFEPNTNYVKVYTPKQTFTRTEWRRMVYQNKPRMRQDDTFGDFDCPDASQTAPRRNSSTTALQALNLLNGALVVQQAAQFADRLHREAPADPEQQVRRAFWLAFGRAPEADESTAAAQLIRQQGLGVFCRALINANEFVFLH